MTSKASICFTFEHIQPGEYQRAIPAMRFEYCALHDLGEVISGKVSQPTTA